MRNITNIMLRKRQSLNLNPGGLVLKYHSKMRTFHSDGNYQLVLSAMLYREVLLTASGLDKKECCSQRSVPQVGR